MAFDVSTITTSGATLIAAATAANKLILAGCDATTDVLTQAQALAVTSRPATPLSTSTRVFLEGAADNHVYCRAIFVAGESTGGDANSLYLYGYSESDPSTIIVLPGSSIHGIFQARVLEWVAIAFSISFLA